MSISGSCERRAFLKGALTAAASSATLLATTSALAEEGSEVSGELLTASILDRKWAFEIPPEPIADDQIAETIEADLIVVGAGTSGLVTANSAIDQGLTVVVVSASEGPISRGGSNNAVYSKALERLGHEKADIFNYEKEIFQASTNVDTAKWYKYYNNSEEAMNWAIDIMEAAGYEVGVEVGTPIDPDSLYAIPEVSHGWMSGDVRNPAMGQQFFVDELASRLEELGGAIYYKNVARQLMRGDVPNGTEGRVTAVIASREDGSYAKYVGSKAIVLATGDFSADPDMMAKYCPGYYNYIDPAMYEGEAQYDLPFQYGGLFKGDGQKMGLWVGAAWQRVFPNCVMGAKTTAPGPSLGYATHWGLMVDRNGRRFMNEYAAAPCAAMAVSLQDGGEAFAIWDSAYAYDPGARVMGLGEGPVGEYVEGTPEQTIAAWDEMVESGQYVKGDTLEEVIEQLGLPLENTMATIERYNEMARNGEDLDFHKRSDVLKEIAKTPFYGHAPGHSPVILTVLGGLRTNVNMQVCDANDNPIPGLYNVGVMVGDVFAGNYSYMICGANYGINCICFGYLTGRYIAENE